MAEGYSIVAITDHEIFIPHPELTDENFVTLHGFGLDYRTIGQALLHGNYYASTGPEIHELWYDDSDAAIHIRCSDAIQISCYCGVRHGRTVRAAERGKENINSYFIKQGLIFGLTENTIFNFFRQSVHG